MEGLKAGRIVLMVMKDKQERPLIITKVNNPEGNVNGILNLTNFDPGSYSSWEPTSTIPSLLSLPLLTVSAQLVLTSTASSGTWQVDDVFVDPLLSRNAR